MSAIMSRAWRRHLPLIALLICVPLILFLLSGYWNGKTEIESLTLTEENIRRAAVQCYALEGFYPPSLDYLVGRYGVSVDEDRYFVDYQYIASNLMPDITVLSISE